MEKHLLISKGSKGWGGPLTIDIHQSKRLLISPGIGSPVVELTE